MIRWPTLILLAMAVIGCSQTTPTPAPSSTPNSPVLVRTATEEPSSTALPTEISGAPSDTPEATITAPATITLLPTVTTAAATTSVKAGTTRVATTALVQFKYPAPVPLGPARPTMFKNNNDITFTYGAVGKLQPSECYLVHAEMINPYVATNNNRGDDYLDPSTSHCGDQSVSGKPLSFVLYRGRFRTSPNYGTILSEALALATPGPKEYFKMTWYVQVVQNNGLSPDGVHYETIPLSPPSAVLDFDFEP
jgi:hypothetical protein